MTKIPFIKLLIFLKKKTTKIIKKISKITKSYTQKKIKTKNKEKWVFPFFRLFLNFFNNFQLFFYIYNFSFFF